MEMFVVVVAAAGFYMFNLPHVHPCQMALPVRWEIIFAHHLHQVDSVPWVAAGCRSRSDVVETMGFVMGSAWAQHPQFPLKVSGEGGARVCYSQRSCRSEAVILNA